MHSPFLPVQSSFWPLLVSLSLFSVISSFVLYVNLNLSFSSFFFSFFFLFLTSFLWWNDFLRESVIGYHTHKLELSLRIAMLLFILSEVFFFC